MKKSQKSRAASDDASGRTDEQAGPTATAKAPVRRACAGVAAVINTPGPGAPRNIWKEDLLPKDGLGFAESLHRMIDLVSVTHDLLRDTDPKMKQKVLEQVLDLAYGRNGRVTEPVKEKENERGFALNMPTADRD